MNAEKRREIKRSYKESLKPMGVFRMYFQGSDYSHIGSSLNLPAIRNRHQFSLRMGMHKDKALQENWNQYGDEAFRFDVLEQLKPEEGEVASPETLAHYQRKLEEREEGWKERFLR